MRWGLSFVELLEGLRDNTHILSGDGFLDVIGKNFEIPEQVEQSIARLKNTEW